VVFKKSWTGTSFRSLVQVPDDLRRANLRAFESTDEEVEQIRLHLESEIHRLEKQAESDLGL